MKFTEMRAVVKISGILEKLCPESRVEVMDHCLCEFCDKCGKYTYDVTEEENCTCVEF